MLLLVLILVLIAFGLLIVALLSGSVLWAWVSVGVSVAAAAVLLLDWLQRRSAVKVAAEPMAGPADDALRTSFIPPDFEPVTEVLPVVPLSGSAPGGAAGFGSPVNGAPRDHPASRLGEMGDGQQTVAMRLLRPPGSRDQPSGAMGFITESDDKLSLNVTDSTIGELPASLPDDADNGAPDHQDGPDRPDVTHPAASRDAAPVVPVDTAAADTATAVRPPSSAPAPPPSSAQALPPPGADRPEAAVSGWAGDLPEPARPPVDAGGTVTDARAGTGVAGAARPVDGPIGDRPTGDRPTDDSPTDESLAEPAVAPPGPDGEPPEEPLDAAAAARVARLEDEVVVVDEQPRYHLGGCRALIGKPLIPLPAREAVELGFTPCGWCTPDHTLANRHPASAH